MKLQGTSGDVLGRPRAVAMAWPWACSLRSSSDIDELGPATTTATTTMTMMVMMMITTYPFRPDPYFTSGAWSSTTNDSDDNGNNDDDDDDDDDDNYVSISARSLPAELGAVVIRHCSRPSIMSEPPLLHEDVRQGGTKKNRVDPKQSHILRASSESRSDGNDNWFGEWPNEIRHRGHGR